MKTFIVLRKGSWVIFVIIFTVNVYLLSEMGHRGGVYFTCFLGCAADFGAVRSTANTPRAM